MHALNGRGLIGCSAGTGCNEVLGSRWSFLFGSIPVSGLAVICYMALTVCLLCRHGFKDDPQFSKWLDRGILALAGAISGSAIWFIWLQKNMIRAFCPYCMTAHICGIILSVILMLRSRERAISRTTCFLCGIAVAGALAGIQLLTTPRTAYDRGFIPEELPLPSPEEMPVIGNHDAENVVTLLFDYRCSHCQKIHPLLEEVAALLDGKVAFVTAPVPISKECNPYVPAGEDRFKGSCQLMRYALAVWRSNPEAFYVFDEWLFEPRPSGGWYPREPEDAYSEACSLIGEQKLQEALSDPWISDYQADICEVFGRTSTDGKGAIPRFIYGGKWLVPEADDAAGLASLVESLLL